MIFKRKLIKIKDCYYLSKDTYSDLCYHKKKKEILNVHGVGEKSGEVFHNKGWNKPKEVLFIDQDIKIRKKLGKKMFKKFKKKKVIDILFIECDGDNCSQDGCGCIKNASTSILK